MAILQEYSANCKVISSLAFSKCPEEDYDNILATG